MAVSGPSADVGNEATEDLQWLWRLVWFQKLDIWSLDGTKLSLSYALHVDFIHFSGMLVETIQQWLLELWWHNLAVKSCPTLLYAQCANYDTVLTITVVVSMVESSTTLREGCYGAYFSNTKARSEASMARGYVASWGRRVGSWSACSTLRWPWQLSYVQSSGGLLGMCI